MELLEYGKIKPITHGNFSGELALTISPEDLKNNWTLNNVLSDFIGGFYKSQSFNENRVATVVNELITNVYKYSSKRKDLSIRFNTIVNKSKSKKSLLLTIENICNKNQFTVFKHYLDQLFNNDLDKVYANNIKKLCKSKNTTSARLGLITLIKDLGVELKITIDSINDEYVVVTQALLDN